MPLLTVAELAGLFVTLGVGHALASIFSNKLINGDFGADQIVRVVTRRHELFETLTFVGPAARQWLLFSELPDADLEGQIF